MMKAVILVGGEATRLRPLTCNTPKIMIPVLNRPFFEHLAGYLKKHNVIDIVLAVGKSPEQIQDYFGDGSRLGVRLTYSIEDLALGTAGAVKNAERFLDDSFVVLNGDIFTDIDLSAMLRLHRKSKAMASLALTPVDDPTIYGVVETDSEGRVRRFIEKPSRDKVTTNMINAGIYILEPDILNHIAPNTFSMFERDVFPPLLEEGQVVYGYPFQDYWIDIGTPDKYLKLHHDLLRRHVGNRGIEFEGESFVHSSAQIEGPAIIGEGCFIDRNSIVKGPAVLGARCRIEEGAVVEGAVLWQGCQISRGAKLRNCLVACRCRVGEESEILDGSILGDDVLVGRGSELSKGTKIWPGKNIGPGKVSS
ncbi:MAG: NDP-sugar synthase [Dehalococcoidia bacterium]|nr:NDP-sugar synthase [Dehalococcoidia bacterium]